jgi:hypothetical protein
MLFSVLRAGSWSQSHGWQALRIVLGSISTHASRYRRYIVPVGVPHRVCVYVCMFVCL